jgi:hypothetical protein
MDGVLRVEISFVSKIGDGCRWTIKHFQLFTRDSCVTQSAHLPVSMARNESGNCKIFSEGSTQSDGLGVLQSHRLSVEFDKTLLRSEEIPGAGWNTR